MYEERQQSSPWTPEEDALLRKLWPGLLPVAQVARKIGRTEAACSSRARKKLGLKPRLPQDLWSKESIELLKNLWSTGLSCSQIAKRIGAITRNAVIGKARRLNLPGRIPCVNPHSYGRKERSNAQRSRKKLAFFGGHPLRRTPRGALASAIPVQDGPEAPIPKCVPLIGLQRHHCRYPIGHPGEADFGFCGHKKLGPLPYCKYHARLAYLPDKQRREH